MLHNEEILTVSSLTRLLKNVLENSFSTVCVEGEISNCIRASSGHFYFSLKDSQSQVRCILWRGIADSIASTPKNGDQFLVYGAITVYEARGDYQIQVKKMIPRGNGQLYAVFEKLKKKLKEEGLFDTSRKRKIVRYPSSVGILTSLKAAALRDILFVINKHRPDIEVVIYPVPVQGKGAGDEIARILRTVYLRNEVDTVLIARGGGSIEDLWAFNEEIVARTIADSPIPTISGIGHETDFTISDFVADTRAATPTAGAHLLGDRLQEKKALVSLYQKMHQKITNLWHQKQQVLDRTQIHLQHPLTKLLRLRQRLQSLSHRMITQIKDKLNQKVRTYNHLLQNLDKSIPCCKAQKHLCEKLRYKLSLCLNQYFEKTCHKLRTLSVSLSHLNPQSVLSRGYSITTDENNSIIRNFMEIKPDQKIKVTLGNGYLEASVNNSLPSPKETNNTEK
ncbi:exodeoxyribonuclease VII large subunit [Candidatus Ichthyocystis sparus]|uniref:exodeoxyribonuclease VII large subunit n=1 Tax=Candidatus Ichthyocystis sparus TaxID=1561004 RepID=UPI000A5594E4|nr:exodeoxyribonuclease VII large subunit [Candidatus Ichthyocystis sparus]